MSTEEKLAPNCKMRSGRRYASDEDCAACGLGEGSACATYWRLRDTRLAELRATVPAKPEPGIKAIAWEIASFLGVTPWAVDNGGAEAWERYKPLAETVMALALSAEVQELREALRPFVKVFEARRDFYSRRHSDRDLGYANFDKMPDGWPMEKVILTMGEFRRARAALKPETGQ